MVYGQSLDMEWTGKNNYNEDILKEIHIHKTGQLLAASCVLGAVSAGASAKDVEKLYSIGLKLGLAYQVHDDLIDDQAGTGKTQGKDKADRKLTYLTLMTRDEATKILTDLCERACEALQAYGSRANVICEMVRRLYK